MRILPTFRAGGPLEEQLTESKLTALVDYIRAITPRSGNRIRATQTESGTLLDLTEGNNPFGDADNPYQCGETKYGSKTSGPGGTGGSEKNFGGSADGNTAWGGNTDTPDATMSNVRTDEWNVRRPPLKYSNNTATRGVTVTMITRVIEANSETGFSRTVFARVLTFDSRGYLYNVSAETIIESSLITGSGSAGGGL